MYSIEVPEHKQYGTLFEVYPISGLPAQPPIVHSWPRRLLGLKGLFRLGWLFLASIESIVSAFLVYYLCIYL